jgi:GNAT superfamily N-acetyltransferase
VRTDPTIEIRAARTEDHPAIIALASSALGWRPGEPNEQLFGWKHVDNPVGPSSMWVAVDAGAIVGFRAFLRWGFTDPERGAQRAVRAVDTATHPDHQGRGIFTALTRHGLEAEREAGTDFVFNTPNDQSRPGYLKLGWQVVGRVPVAVAVGSPAAALRMARARVPAGKWSEPSTAGFAAPDVLGDERGVTELLASLGPGTGLRTTRTPELLRWRYGLEPLRYRVLLRGASVTDGLAVFRVRRRGAAVETALVDVLVPGGDHRARRDLVRAVLVATRPDYVIGVQRRVVSGRSVRLPGQGPLLTWRGVNRSDRPEADRWDLALGDIELF